SEIKRFQEDSLGGEYYESFDVNSRNFMDKSEGTENWIAECERLFNRCTAEENRSDPKLTREAMGILFDLLRHIDGGYDDVVFFADEGGSWQVGVDWDKVLPVWFLCLSEAENPEEYAGQVLGIIEDFVDYDKKKYLALARKKATPEQKKLLRGA
ncbi:MAG: hypothetical protein GY731_03760, partial [Gammaproteobacteria bacterium]|nr:hypothetical protein [Gammaproteobacteria bacterium]